MDLNAFYRQQVELQEKYGGRRCMLINHPDADPREAGTTGRLQASEDGLTMYLDHPLPEWTRDYEDAARGELIFDDDARFVVVDEDYPIHSGQNILPRKA